MAPAPKSSPDWRAAYSTLNSTAFRRRISVGGHIHGRSSTPRPHCLFGQTYLGTRCHGLSGGCRGMPRRGTPARGEARLCRVSCANSKRFRTKSSCKTHSVTSLYHAGVRNMEQAVPRYHVCFTVTAAALARSTYKTSDGASKRTQKYYNPSLFTTPVGPSPRARHCMVNT